LNKNLAFLSACFLCGILTVQTLAYVPTYPLLLLALCVALVAIKHMRWLSVLLAGFLWASLFAQYELARQLPADMEGQEILLQGRVVDLPRINNHATQLIIDVTKVLKPAGYNHFSGRIKLNWYKPHSVPSSAETWQFLVKLKRPYGYSNPYSFDYERWLFQQKIHATAYVRKSELNKRVGAAEFWRIDAWRQSLSRYLSRVLQDNQHVGIIQALVLGNRNDISQQQWDVFRRTGTSHLVAISGLHIGLVSALVFGFVRAVCLRFSYSRQVAIQCAVLVSLLCAVMYAALAGFSIPTLRALMMLAVIFGGLYWERHYRVTHIISAALVGVLLLDPIAVLSIGFWLSFAAVAIILYGFMGRVGGRNFVVKLLYTQWLVALGLMPLVLYFFQQVSLVAPLANIVAVPYLSFALVPTLMFGLMAAMVSGDVGAVVLNFSADILDLLWRLLTSLSSFHYAQWGLPQLSLIACVFAMLGVLLLLLPRGLVPKPAALMLFVPMIFSVPPTPLNQGEFKLVLLDVGQGLSVLVETAEHTLLYDTGAHYPDTASVASMVILPYLEAEKTDRLDALVVSHGDNDHAGGVKTITTGLAVNRVYSSVPEELAHIEAKKCMDDINWQWDGVRFTFLHPDAVDLFDGNNGSCVLHISSIAGSALLSGDIEKYAERAIVRDKDSALLSNVLVVPHHGSSTSSSEIFLDAVKPQIALFAVGYKNRFNFPKKAILERYQQRGIKTYSSAEDGALSVFFLEGVRPHVSSYREVSRRYWHWKP
jgi:competence protein ComEC